MTNTDYRQFIDEIYFLGKQKEYSGIFNKVIPSLNVFKKAKNILIDKRKAYDFAIANLFRKYGINNDNLYEELDDIWDSIEELPLDLKSFIISGVTFAGSVRKMVSLVIPIAVPIFGGTSAITYRIAKLQLIFNSYIEKTREYCDNVAKEEIDEQK